MFRIACALAAMLLVSFAGTAPSRAQSAPEGKKKVESPAMAKKASACRKQGEAQKLHFEDLGTFMHDCLRK